MAQLHQKLVASFIAKAIEYCQPDKALLLQACADMLLEALSGPQGAERKPRGPQGDGVTITLENYGYVVTDTQAQAAELLGIAPATLAVKLSQGKGTYHRLHTDPNTGNPMPVTVERGRLAEDTIMARQVLAASGNDKAKQAARAKNPAPNAKPQRDANGKVISRIKREPGVINS